MGVEFGGGNVLHIREGDERALVSKYNCEGISCGSQIKKVILTFSYNVPREPLLSVGVLFEKRGGVDMRTTPQSY